jgi:glucose-1-phosphate cytidylyltransferase
MTLMKVAILAGGVGSRLSEETETKPKPMVEIGGKPILWHIMTIFAQQGHRDFVVALGYKGEVIKKYIIDYCALNANLAVNLRTGAVRMHTEEPIVDWDVNLVDTGLGTETGGRVKRLQPYIGNERFMLAWGDGVADIDLDALLRFHRAHGRLATLTAVRPPARFGHLELDGERVSEFSEKPQTAEGWINGGMFILEPEVFDYIEGDHDSFERGPLVRLARDGQLMAYRHDSFWQCMDTLRDRKILEELWATGNAPWRITTPRLLETVPA